MRHFLFTLIAVLGFGSLASAADLPVKAARAIASPVYNWTGCYVGANVGYGWQKNQTYDPYRELDAGSQTGSGAVGGGQAGCDYQFSGNWVVGIQGMFNAANISGSNVFTGYSDEFLGFNARAFGTLTGRIGYAVMPQTLLYFKGGAAWVKTKYTDNCLSVDCYGPTVGNASATRSGWTIGAGGEYAVDRNWSLFAEYGFIDISNHDVTLTYTGSCTDFSCIYSYKEKQTLQTVLVGLNYRFGR